jgi:hypothetical protein
MRCTFDFFDDLIEGIVVGCNEQGFLIARRDGLHAATAAQADRMRSESPATPPMLSHRLGPPAQSQY